MICVVGNLAPQICVYLSGMWRIAMFKQVNSLPRAQRHFSVLDGNRHRNGQQGRFDMRGHIIWSFLGVC